MSVDQIHEHTNTLTQCKECTCIDSFMINELYPSHEKKRGSGADLLKVPTSGFRCLLTSRVTWAYKHSDTMQGMYKHQQFHDQWFDIPPVKKGGVVPKWSRYWLWGCKVVFIWITVLDSNFIPLLLILRVEGSTTKLSPVYWRCVHGKTPSWYKACRNLISFRKQWVSRVAQVCRSWLSLDKGTQSFTGGKNAAIKYVNRM